MNRAVGRVSRGETAGTRCRGFTRQRDTAWGGFADNISCAATGFASFMPAVRRAKIKFFLNLTLAPGQFLKAVLALKLRADFFAKLFDALVGIGDVQLQSFRAFFKSLNRRFQ
jgi:hypothetical protein